MNLVTLADAELAFGLHPLLDGAALTVDDAERIGLIGRNGTGKSSLLQVIAGRLELDAGEVRREPHVAVVRVRRALHDPEQARLARAVAADEPDVLARLDDEVDVVEQRHMAVGERDAGELEKRQSSRG